MKEMIDRRFLRWDRKKRMLAKKMGSFRSTVRAEIGLESDAWPPLVPKNSDCVCLLGGLVRLTGATEDLQLTSVSIIHGVNE
jgi:hypothetical protein